MTNNLWTGCGTIQSIKTITIKDHRGDYTVTDLVLVIKRNVKGVDRLTFTPCECWGIRSEEAQRLKEGDWICLEGRFENKRWTNKEKVEMSKNVIAVERFKVGE